MQQLIFQVRASAVFVPEASEANGGAESYYFSYSIRMSLLPEGCMLDGVYYSSCQLHSRHWIIRSKDTIVDNVHGEAVIGQVSFLFLQILIKFSVSWGIYHTLNLGNLISECLLAVSAVSAPLAWWGRICISELHSRTRCSWICGGLIYICSWQVSPANQHLLTVNSLFSCFSKPDLAFLVALG